MVEKQKTNRKLSTELQAVQDLVYASSFNKNFYSVSAGSMGFHEFKKDSLVNFTDIKSHNANIVKSSKDILDKATPGFQRNNNKWTKNMATSYVENILTGYVDSIKLFRIGEVYSDAQILDGLQRTTAILKMIDGKIKPFGYNYMHLHNSRVRFRIRLSIAVYDFDTWKDVGKFYVAMNENITHSKKDIQKAKDWFMKEKGIIL